MDLHEFELRYLSYQGLQHILGLDRDEATLISATKKTTKGQLTKSLPETSIEELRDLTRQTYTQDKQKLITNYQDQTYKQKPISDYIERLEYEFKVIDAMGYNTYFLVVADYINWAKEDNIVVGPGRGSCAGSLLSYSLGITDLDPLEYDLIFERFLNPGRISMPDIDTDFEDTQRDRVIEYIREKYGKEKVAHIGTYMTMAAKAAFKDVARVYGVNFEQSNKVSALVTEKTIAKSLKENKDLAQMAENDQRINNVLRIAERMEGTIRQTGVHACGMIIAPEATTNYTVIQHPPQSGKKDSRDESRIVSQFDGGTVEEIGLLKMDLLGLRNLSIIKNTIKIISAKSKKEGTEIPPMFQEFNETMLFHPPLDDEHTYKTIFHTGNTSGVFQFESDGMKGWLKKLKASHFDDLIAMVSLYRPGPMEYIPHYVDRKYEIEKVTYMDPELRRIIASTYSEAEADAEKAKIIEDLKPFMDVTYGIPVYQEQLMRIVQAMAGFSMAEADKLRKGVGKKIREVIEKIKIEFIKKAAEHRDYKKETAQWIYEKMIEPAADYSFNKSHAACYAYISYQTAWLKAHYPLAFHAALLRSVEEDNDKLARFIDEIKLQGLEIRIPHINESFEHVAAVEDYIILGFSAIKGIGSDVAQHIESERAQGGNFKDLPDFLTRCSDYINKKSLEALIKSGALDTFYNRATLWHNVQRIIDWIKSSEQHASQGGGLFAMEEVQGASLDLDPQPGLPLLAKLSREFAVFKSLISAHPLDGMYDYLRGKYTFISMMKDVEGFGDFTVLGMIKSINRGMRGGFFIMVEDISGEMEFFLNEKLDLKVFDIINIQGYKGRRFPSTEQITVFKYSKLLEKIETSGRYKPEKTVALIRAERFAGSMKSEEKQIKSEEEKTNEMNNSSSGELLIKEPSLPYTTTSDKATDTPPVKGVDSSEPSEELSGGLGTPNTSSTQTIFPTPDSMLILAKLPAIIKAHPGEIDITIGNMEAKVSEEGVEKIRELLL